MQMQTNRCYTCGKELGESWYQVTGTKVCAWCHKIHGIGAPFSPPKNERVTLEAPDFEIVSPPADLPEEYPFITTLQDDDLTPKQRDIRAKYHFIAKAWPVLVYRVTAGFRLKKDAPAFGSCRDDLKYAQNWNFTDIPTVNGIVYCTVFQDGRGWRASEQKAALRRTAKRLGLPPRHLISFGEASLVALIMLHYRKENYNNGINKLLVPSGWHLRTDTLNATGSWRISFNQDDVYGLACENDYTDDAAGNTLGCLAIGIDDIT